MSKALIDHVKHLIDTLGSDGGFARSIGAVLHQARPQHLHAFFETGRTYGVYH